MNEALELIKIKCQKEKIDTIQGFDEKIAIHYTFNEIINKYFDIIDKNISLDFETQQSQKANFLIQISQIINIDVEDRIAYVGRIIEEDLEDDLLY